MSRTRSFRRDVRNRKIARKKRLCRELYGASIGGVESPGKWYNHDGQYSKGKIHCSCKMCTYSKTYGLPTLKDKKEREVVKEALSNY